MPKNNGLLMKKLPNVLDSSRRRQTESQQRLSLPKNLSKRRMSANSKSC